jgi:hypothetical protein
MIYYLLIFTGIVADILLCLAFLGWWERRAYRKAKEEYQMLERINRYGQG